MVATVIVLLVAASSMDSGNGSSGFFVGVAVSVVMLYSLLRAVEVHDAYKEERQ